MQEFQQKNKRGNFLLTSQPIETMPRRLNSTTDPEVARFFKKFRQQGKTPEKAISLARRFVALQEIKTRAPFNSAEAAVLIRLGFFRETHKPPFGNN